jgi:peptidoglycan hydrolase-like protein with peptidoglycan-binding domain
MGRAVRAFQRAHGLDANGTVDATIRLTNWDASALAAQVRPGTSAVLTR